MFAPCRKACGNQMHPHRIRQLQMVSAVLKMLLPLQRRLQQTRPRRQIPRRWTQSVRVAKLNSPSCAKLKSPKNAGVLAHLRDPDGPNYGLGGARPLSRFLDMAGLDMVKQTASTQGWCSKGQPPPPEFL